MQILPVESNIINKILPICDGKQNGVVDVLHWCPFAFGIKSNPEMFHVIDTTLASLYSISGVDTLVDLQRQLIGYAYNLDDEGEYQVDMSNDVWELPNLSTTGEDARQRKVIQGCVFKGDKLQERAMFFVINNILCDRPFRDTGILMHDDEGGIYISPKKCVVLWDYTNIPVYKMRVHEKCMGIEFEKSMQEKLQKWFPAFGKQKGTIKKNSFYTHADIVVEITFPFKKTMQALLGKGVFALPLSPNYVNGFNISGNGTLCYGSSSLPPSDWNGLCFRRLEQLTNFDYCWSERVTHKLGYLPPNIGEIDAQQGQLIQDKFSIGMGPSGLASILGVQGTIKEPHVPNTPYTFLGIRKSENELEEVLKSIWGIDASVVDTEKAQKLKRLVCDSTNSMVLKKDILGTYEKAVILKDYIGKDILAKYIVETGKDSMDMGNATILSMLGTPSDTFNPMKLFVEFNSMLCVEYVKQVVDTSIRAFDVQEMKEVSLKDISAKLIISEVKNMGIDYYLDFKRYQELFASFMRGEVSTNNTNKADIAMCLYEGVFLLGAIGPQNEDERKYLDASLLSIYKDQILHPNSGIQIGEKNRIGWRNMEQGLFVETELQYSPINIQGGKMLVYKNMQFRERITCPIRHFAFYDTPQELSVSTYTQYINHYINMMAIKTECREDISNWYNYLQGNYASTMVLNGLERKVCYSRMPTGQVSHKISEEDMSWMNLIEKIGPYTRSGDNQRAISDADLSFRNGLIKVERDAFSSCENREYYYFRGLEHFKKQLGWQLGFHFRIQNNVTNNAMYLFWAARKWIMCYCGVNALGVVLDTKEIQSLGVNPFATTANGLMGIVLLPEFLLGIYRKYKGKA
jgi:hypothetical protein